MVTEARNAFLVIGILAVAVVPVSAGILEDSPRRVSGPQPSRISALPELSVSETTEKEAASTRTADEAQPPSVVSSSTTEEDLAPQFEQLSGWPHGATNAVASDGDYMYAGVGGMVKIVDVTDPAHPQEVASIVTKDAVLNLFLDGNMLYVANRRAGIRIINVTDPLNPWEVGADDTEYVEDVYVSYPYAYMAAGGDLRIIDVSEPGNPVLAGAGVPSIEVGGAWGVHVIGDYAYTAFSEALEVFDVSDPDNPVEVGRAQFESGGCGGLYVHDGFAYLQCGHNGLHIVDVGNPESPEVSADLYTSDWVWDVDGAGDTVYVHAWNALYVLDVGDPSNPVEVGRYGYETRHDYGDMCVFGNYAYVTHTYRGVRIFDVHDPANPVKVGFFETSGPLWDVQASGPYAYVVNSDFYVLDISDPSKPIEVGSLSTPGEASSVCVARDRAYVSDTDGLYIIDVRTPSSPVEIGFFDPSNDGDAAGGGIDFDDGYVYLAREASGLFMIDVSDPSDPEQVGLYRDENSEMSIKDVFVRNGYAYLAVPSDEAHAGFYVLDVSDPSTPVEVTSVAISDPPQSVDLFGDYAYVGCYKSGLRVFDISDPSSPVQVGAFDIRETRYGPGSEVLEVYAAEDHAYLTLDGMGLLMLDVSDPSDPLEMGRMGTIDAFGVDASDGTVYIADRR